MNDVASWINDISEIRSRCLVIKTRHGATIVKPIETDRLLLRPTIPKDWPYVRDFLMCEDTMRHLGGHQEEADAWRTLAQWIGVWSLTDAAMFGVIEKSSGEWIGRIGPWHPLHWPTLEVGWGLRKVYWGKGYAFEAASACIDFAFDELGWDEVTHLIEDANTPSQLLATRLGAVPQEYVHLPGQLSNVRLRVWRQSKEHWLASK